MPPGRTLDYICTSGVYSETVTVTLPKNVKVTTLPGPQTLTAEGVELHMDYKQLNPDTVRADTRLRLSHPDPYCSAAAYAKLRPALSKMVGTLQSQILYK